MNSSIITASVSMGGLQKKLDLIADNIANVNTVGYKRKDSTFEDLLTSFKQQPEEFRQDGRMSPLGYGRGWGSRFVQTGPDMTQGTFKETGMATDVAIGGRALFEVATDLAGGRAYTRNGAFELTKNENGVTILGTQEGYPVMAVTGTDAATGQPVEGPVAIPDGYRLAIDSEGVITGVNAAGDRLPLGRLKLVEPVRPEELSPTANNLFNVPAGVNRGDILRDFGPDAADGITVRQGFLEQSNVDLTQEMTDLMNVQRAYQLVARAISSSDTMQSLANNMRGS
ncbi:flagellar hook-basal body protein [Paenibacillus beijingensis]|uniref:Flagellar hook-basal body protein n=1 Tax=Paenibacillus beijingensis TaxID=1126833 RepID=A0A0D5NHU1_9BACL|nr:flagellar hook-basal body protein [Paenibacillus beijingensis]AJY74547.1 flagellar hook-basal body protein [Paenibacillus beijingensis]